MPPRRKSNVLSARDFKSSKPTTPVSLPRRVSSRSSFRGTTKSKAASQNVPSSPPEIPDSDDFADTIMIESEPSSASLTLKEVVIPVLRQNHGLRINSTIADGSRTSSSVADSLDESDYETPATSANVTPAESVERDALTKPSKAVKIAPRVRGVASRGSMTSSARSSAKRGVGFVLGPGNLTSENSDAKLAMELQAEEYEREEDSMPPPKRQKAAHATLKRQIRDSDEDSDEELSDLSSFDSDLEDDVPIASSVRRGRGRPPATRPARQAVTKKPAAPIITIDADSDDLSDLDSVKLNALAQETEESEFDSAEIISDAESANTSSALDSATEGVPVTAPVRPSARSRRDRRNRWTQEDKKARERAKLEKSHPILKTLWADLERIARISPVAGEQPPSITRKLKKFQLEGLDWMIRQEQSQWRGGLLGDEMGMGKTIQAVSLIMSDYPAKNPSLVVVPPVALMQWQAEIKSYTDGKLKVLVFHGSNSKAKSLSIKEAKKFDVIMISYSGLESVYRKENKGWNRDGGIIKEDSMIHALHYHRVILDEAHSIKSRTTGVAKACFALKADFKWCLSGTPVQNRIGEFFSLLRFLDVQPFACYFCKYCKCQQLHWAQDASHQCIHCKHSGFQHVSLFNQEILNPITQSEDDNTRRDALAKLRLITDRIMLRRMKKDYTSSMELPPKEVIIHNEFFGEEERDFSQAIMTNNTRKFDTYVAQGVMLNNYANIFGLIMQMRQTANHPDLILRKHAEGGQNVLICCICDEPAEEAIRSRCRHEFCRQCAKDYIRSFEGMEEDEDAEPNCPRCHIPLSIDFEQPDIEQEEDNVKRSSIINRIKMEDWTSSTKIEMLIYDLYKLRSKKVTQKSIVFSQFTSMLQLVEWRLRRAGFSTVMLDGSMSPAQRQKSIEYFMNNVHVEVFLVSLKAGGVALNLTEASRVFIVDPWWNPAAEWQSADRCHRIGQKRPCTITRLCIEDSVESRMVLLQEKKANMINGTVNNDQVALDKLTPEDMQFLFRGT